MVLGAEIAPDLPSAAGRAEGSDRPARPLRQAGLLELVPIAPSARCEERPQPGTVIAIARPPPQQAFPLAVRDPAVLPVKGAPLSCKPVIERATLRENV